MMAITRVQSASANNGATATTSLTASFETGLQSGRLLVVAACSAQNTAPGGFSSVGVTWTHVLTWEQGVVSASPRVLLGIGRVGSGAGLSVTFTSPTSTAKAMVAAEYSGLEDHIIDVLGANQGNAANPSVTAPVATRTAESLWLAVIGWRTSAAPATAPTGGFSVVDQTATSLGTASDRSVVLLDRIVAATGTPDAGVTLPSSQYYAAIIASVGAGNQVSPSKPRFFTSAGGGLPI